MPVTARIVHKTHIDVSKIAKRLRGPSTVKVGFPAGKADAEQVQKAIWNHFGTQGGGWGGPIPARPFMTNAFRDNKSKYNRALVKSAKWLLSGETTLARIMHKLGNDAQDDIKAEIKTLSTPANSPVTIAIKGSSNPLVDGGKMLGAVTYELNDD